MRRRVSDTRRNCGVRPVAWTTRAREVSEPTLFDVDRRRDEALVRLAVLLEPAPPRIERAAPLCAARAVDWTDLWWASLPAFTGTADEAWADVAVSAASTRTKYTFRNMIGVSAETRAFPV